MLSMLFRTSAESDRLIGVASSSFSVASDEYTRRKVPRTVNGTGHTDPSESAAASRRVPFIAVKPVPGDFSELDECLLATGETTDATDD